MRRRSVLLAVPAGLLALAGCNDDSGSEKGQKVRASEPGETASSAPPAPTGKVVSGPLPEITSGAKFGQKPTVAKGPGQPSRDLAVRVHSTGDGPTVGKGDYLRVNYSGQIWKTARVFDSSWKKGSPALFPIGIGQVIPGWDQALVGKKVGSRVEMAIPPALGYGEQGAPQVGIKGDDTLVFVVDILDTFTATSSAKGATVAQDDKDLPKVGTNTDGKAPEITIPKTDAPKKLVAEYVIEGDGPKVKATDSVLVQYKGVLWDGGKEFDSTYKRKQPTQFSLQQVVKGWSQGLTGKKAGSRVMIVIPPELGYGNQEQQGIPANSTLVFSVDILAVL
ncbi:FKBP-type peptidyl-prolyl cis-trans isomerase [Streptomyces palmae]|uniref:peptidylprolyl isomerase n=1 Tax=Streptomyces palmae TaxID=1701085 RepID=A0A4Z0HCA7_9ACTN|nr:FKBP-type peptidyl-prolyl cis-trans isomerase [Streptomyces palmae]TGB14352.1 FKBP-type peptidyl-prolyl cis-trans isomerase [Streptomyces palmae]